MSEPLFARDGAERVARIWQPADFLHASGRLERFVATSWRPDAPRVFEDAWLPQLPPGGLPRAAAQEAVQELQDEDLAAEPVQAMPEASLQAGPQVSEQALEAARQEAYARGLAEGRQQAQQEHAQSRAAQDSELMQCLQNLQAAVAQLQASPEQLYEPLKRLALHLAEQLVLGELTQSSQAVERLVRRCVDELAPKGVAVQIALHPDDLALLQPWLERSQAEATAKPAAPWRLQADESLQPGSVRASADDAVVNDLIEHRLDALARQLLVDPQRSAGQSAFQPERLAARRADVDAVLDAQPRMAKTPRNPRFAPVVEAPSPTAPGLADEASPPSDGQAPPESLP